MKNVLKKSVAIVMLFAMVFVPIASAQPKMASADTYAPVTAYVDSEWGGTSQEFYIGSYNVDELKSGVGNDTISSLRIAPGYQVTMYKNSNYGGSTLVLTSDIDNLKNYSFNDMISSIKIEAISPLDDSCIAVSDFSDATMQSLMTEFAPRIWMAQGETYWASSIEFGLQNLQRYYDTNLGMYSLKTNETLSSATSKLAFFSGDQSTARCYAFWTEKTYNNIDISYWQYCPYNYGKVVLGMEFGDHIGDWEHVTVRLAKFTYNGVNYVKPVFVALPYHSSINIYEWDFIDKVSGTNHPIAYCAKESHGMWKDAGNHVYMNIVVSKLTDVCSAGTAMDCWTILNTYQYYPNTASGRGIGSTPWCTYFDSDYTNPDSNAVYRWGNEGQGTAFGQDVLSDGPRGPEGHSALYSDTDLK